MDLFRSLHMKLTLILLLLITSLMAVVGAFLTANVSTFYIDTFYEQVESVFGSDQRDFVADLRDVAAESDGAALIDERLKVKAGSLGIDYRTRNYFILDGTTGNYITGSAAEAELPREQSANLLTARTAVVNGDAATVGADSNITADYMDVAVPIMGGENAYIIYILDTKDTVSDLNSQLFTIIMQALIIGLLPMMFAHGVGANGNRTLGTGSIGGMLIGMILQVLIVPAMFVIFQKIQEKISPIKFKDLEPGGTVENEVEQFAPQTDTEVSDDDK